MERKKIPKICIWYKSSKVHSHLQPLALGHVFPSSGEEGTFTGHALKAYTASYNSTLSSQDLSSDGATSEPSDDIQEFWETDPSIVNSDILGSQQWVASAMGRLNTQ